MLKEIEEAVASRLVEKIAEATNIRIDEVKSDDTLNFPSIEVIISGGAFTRVAQNYRLTCKVYVIITLQNMRSVRDRRHGIYPIIEAAQACLVLQDLGLAIDKLVPKRLDNITTADETGEGKVVFQLEFETGFIVEQLSETKINDLIRIGLNYYLTVRDDEDVDAQDEVTLT